MVSKTLLQLVDRAVLPAVLVGAAKILGVILFSSLFDLSYEAKGMSLVFSTPEAFLKVTSYSDLIVLGVITGGLGWVVLRSNFLHDNHLSPELAVRLVSLDLLDLIGASVAIYQQAVVWLSYAWLFTIYLGFQFYLGLVWGWVFLVAVFVCLNATWLILFDVEREARLLRDYREDDGWGSVSLD